MMYWSTFKRNKRKTAEKRPLTELGYWPLANTGEVNKDKDTRWNSNILTKVDNSKSNKNPCWFLYFKDVPLMSNSNSHLAHV
jgi:hypothetical protein